MVATAVTAIFRTLLLWQVMVAAMPQAVTTPAGPTPMDMAADIQVMVGELGAMPLIMPGEAVLAAIKAEVETHRNHGMHL
jgi:hypothetical protein